MNTALIDSDNGNSVDGCDWVGMAHVSLGITSYRS